jgi:hypothetical protein
MTIGKNTTICEDGHQFAPNGRIAAVKRFTFHPLLISLFPALTLLAHNIEEVKPTVALRSLAASFIGAAVLFLLLRLLCRDWKRSAILATIVLVWFFSYGHIYDSVKHFKVAGFLVGRHGFLLPVWLITLTLTLWWAAKKLKDTATMTLALNVIAIAVLIVPLVQITLFEIRAQEAWSNCSQASTQEIYIPDGTVPPDIYYIILDAYSRDDILKSEFGYDNTPFINDLTRMGFYVARCSQSNYGQTELSLVSSLNFDYLQALGDQFVSSSTNREPLEPLLKHSAVRQMLEGIGYTTVAFETGYMKTELEDADYFLTPPRQGTLKNLFTTGGLNNFEVMYLHSTAGLLLTDFAQKLHLPQKLVPDVSYPNRKHRERELYVLGQLQFNHVPSLQSPKLVFVHLVVPHHPFVFGPNGERVNLPDYDKNGYRDQVIFINKQITAIVKDLITYSDHPPVIVIQGDHGAPAGLIPDDKHMAILNAYYLPGVDPSSLYAGISPVNTFRVIFNQYFGGSYPLLEDVAYFSPYKALYDFKIMPDPQPVCEVK